MKVFLAVLILCFFFKANGQSKIVLIDSLGVDSIIQAYHTNGKLFFQAPYVHGMQNGWYEQFHDNGVIWVKQLRINGKTVDGYNVAYWDNGRISQKGYFKNGHEVGKWYCYTKDGNPFKIYIYNRKGDWVKLKVWNEKRKKWEKSRLY
jgi:antitoxin component YwqK of YwqJK toxin-antitoxin module